jgi:hypothetical protein
MVRIACCGGENKSKRAIYHSEYKNISFQDMSYASEKGIRFEFSNGCDNMVFISLSVQDAIRLNVELTKSLCKLLTRRLRPLQVVNNDGSNLCSLKRERDKVCTHIKKLVLIRLCHPLDHSNR